MRTVWQVEPKDRWRVAEEIQKDIVGATYRPSPSAHLPGKVPVSRNRLAGCFRRRVDVFNVGREHRVGLLTILIPDPCDELVPWEFRHPGIQGRTLIRHRSENDRHIVLFAGRKDRIRQRR